VNELDAARADMNRAIDLNRALGDGEGLAETYNSLGIIDDHRHDPAAAIVDYTRAIVVLARRRENAPQAYYNRALLHARQHDDRAAVTDFTTAIAQFADSPSDQADAYYERANALTRLHEPARAMADYDSAIKLNYALADAFRARGDLRCDEAARLAATDPHGAAAAYDRAVGDYERYLEIRPDDAEVRKLRADAQAKGQALGGASEPAASPAPAAKG
jgi:tetratricopeptide (TPR) repeat protein